MKFAVDRFQNVGTAVGGHVIDEGFAFAADFPVAAIRVQLGFETCWLSRDEAHQVAALLMEAAADA